MVRLLYSILFAVTLSIAAHAQAIEPPLLKVGFVLSQTGPWAEYGHAQKNALELARSEHPERFERIKFIYEDCQYASRHAVEAFNKLRTVDKVDMIFVWGVEPSLVLAPLAERYKMPLIASAIHPDIAAHRRYVIRTINYGDQYGEKLLEYFRSKNQKHIGIVTTEISFHQLLISGIRRNLAPDETLEIVESVLPGDTDMLSVVTKLKSKNVDTLGLFLTPAQIINFTRHADAQGVQLPYFGIMTFESRTLVQQAGSSLVGAVYSHNLVSERFAESYRQYAGDDIQLPWGANAYDFGVLLGELFGGKTETPSTHDILTALSSISQRSGAGGHYQLAEDPNGGKFYNYPVVVKQVQENAFRLVARPDSSVVR